MGDQITVVCAVTYLLGSNGSGRNWRARAARFPYGIYVVHGDQVDEIRTHITAMSRQKYLRAEVLVLLIVFVDFALLIACVALFLHMWAGTGM